MVFDGSAMDKAAQTAAEELEQLPADAVQVVADWLQKHYLEAGYKRLGRVLLKKSSSRVANALSELIQE
jgi:chaperonin cofactor prefoldin